MKPAFAVVVNGKDITKGMEAGLVSINTTDEAGMKSDSVTVSIADPRKEIALPRKGVTMVLHLGWKHSGISPVGTYKVSKVGRSGRPSTINITGDGADLTGSSKLKQQKTRSFDNITIGTLVGRIAAEHGMKAAVGQEYRGVLIAHLDQVDESDLNLLTRVATDHGAVFKPAEGNLVFVKNGDGKTASGKELPTIAIAEGDCSDWSIEIAEHTEYKSVVAYWQDTAEGARKEVKVGEGEPVYTIRKPYSSEAAARAGAQAKADDLARGTGAGNVTLAIGNPAVFAESPLSLTGFDPDLDGRWKASKVSHALSGSGFTTAIEVEPPTS